MSAATRYLVVLLRRLTAEREVLEVFGPAAVATPAAWQAAWLVKRWSR